MTPHYMYFLQRLSAVFFFHEETEWSNFVKKLNSPSSSTSIFGIFYDFVDNLLQFPR